jgi:hypothetical protein
MMTENIGQTYPSNLEGLEDVRLFSFKGNIYYNAFSKNVTNDNNIVMTVGEYNVKDSIIHNVDIIQSPRPSNCEKNWIFVPEYSLVGNESAKNKMNFIYGFA